MGYFHTNDGLGVQVLRQAKHLRHIPKQAPVISALAKIAYQALGQKLGLNRNTTGQLPGPYINASLPPRNPKLIHDFIDWTGGRHERWRGQVPPTLFPQWGFPLLGETLRGIEYPLTDVLNAGCKLTIHRPVAQDSDLRLRARLEKIEATERRALLFQSLETSDDTGNLCIHAEMRAMVRLNNRGGPLQKKKVNNECLPSEAQMLDEIRLGPNSGLEFACLTGDFNPIHWLPPYAKLAGFGRPILHGFGSLAIALEQLEQTAWSQISHRPRWIDVRFTRPLRLPNQVCVFTHKDRIWVADTKGGRIYLDGQFGLKDEKSQSHD